MLDIYSDMQYIKNRKRHDVPEKEGRNGGHQ